MERVSLGDKSYLKVQDVERKNCGHKTYTTQVTDITLYKREDYLKAFKHASKRAANTITLTDVEYLEDIPYVKTTTSWGEKTFRTINDEVHKVIEFKEFGIYFDLDEKEIRDM